MDRKIQFFSDGILFRISGKEKIRAWLNKLMIHEKKTHSLINFIFCDDEYLLNLNKIYLKRDYLTDVITFSNSDKKHISGDVYISIERVQENSATFEQPFEKELLRVIVHGTLHLVGYKDKTSLEKEKMRQKEDYYLSRIKL